MREQGLALTEHPTTPIARSGGQLMPNAWSELASRLESLLRLRSFPFGMKLFERRADIVQRRR
jgi:hypothetical protein